MVKNLPSNEGDMGLIPGWGNKIPHTMRQLSLHATTRQSVICNERPCMTQRRSCVLQLRSNAAKQIHILKKTTPTPSHNPKSGDVHGAMAGKCVQARAVCLPSLPTGIWASGRSCSHNSHFSLQPYHLAVNLSSEQIFPPRSPVIQLSG